MVKNNVKNALNAWKKNDIAEFSEAPILVRIVGLVIVAISTVFALTA